MPEAAALEFAFGFLATAVLVRFMLPYLTALRVGQPVRSQGPERHRQKAGTPTMGGLAIVLGFAAAALSAAQLTPAVAFALVAAAGFGLVGFADDYLKVVRRRPLGLLARYKLAGELAFGLALGWAATAVLGLPTRVEVPFLSLGLDFGPLYPPFLALVAVAAANAANFTDGADGLLAGVTLPMAAVLGWYGYASGALDAVPLAIALAGALAGFLAWNAHPARIIMGDTGSMAIGGLVAALAALTKTELWLLVYGLVWVLEVLSVIVQVASFRLLGRRILRMSPLHHHFEVAGWPEPRVVIAFWAVSAAASAAALAGLVAEGARP
ncbi:MAG: phospho-N-acetylmuramoyl-pentapeptide-transferase [Clostridia bacterium]|nr:phospho-N-acetylmuramoyl-pentapeptide-transferase [Clostridia bacterium]